MVLGELVPKNLAIAGRWQPAKFIQRPLLQFSKAMKYPILVLNSGANAILKQFGVKPQEELASARRPTSLLAPSPPLAEKGTLPKATALCWSAP